jgi:hypothetical protein
MKHTIKMFFLFAIALVSLSAQSVNRKDIGGYWWMYDDHKVRTGIAYIYEFEGKYYGRTLYTISPETGKEEVYSQPESKAKHIDGNPYTTGMDIVWNLTWDEKKQKYTKGAILDPRKKNPYQLDAWREGDVLKIYGNIIGMGVTIDWPMASVSDLPAGAPAINEALTPKLYYAVKD